MTQYYFYKEYDGVRGKLGPRLFYFILCFLCSFANNEAGGKECVCLWGG